MKVFSRYLALTPVERRALHRALLWMPALVVGVHLLPFQAVTAIAARATAAGRRATVNRREQPAGARPVVETVAWAVEAVGRRMGATCLPRALAGCILLAGFGESSTVRVGVAKSDRGQLKAHAWLVWQGRTIVGELEGIGEYHAFPAL